MAEEPRRAYSAADSLPPVEPPSAGFLVQLFLVPFTIVAIIVSVLVAFTWLAHLGNDPQSAVRALRRNNEGRWQAALNLANELRGPAGGTLKVDEALAGELASVLSDEIKSGRPAAESKLDPSREKPSQTLCIYLCRALGEFAVPGAAPPLVARAEAIDQPEIARAAVEALAVLAANLAAAGRRFGDPDAVTAAVVAASRSDDPGLRSSAAFSLGVVGGAAAAGRLVELLDGPDDNVRANAAVGLARLGREEAWDALGEMLGAADVTVAAGDHEAQAKRYKRVMVVVNAIKAVGLLVDASGRRPPAAIEARLDVLAGDAVPDVRRSAIALSRRIDRLGDDAPAALAEEPPTS